MIKETGKCWQRENRKNHSRESKTRTAQKHIPTEKAIKSLNLSKDHVFSVIANFLVHDYIDSSAEQKYATEYSTGVDRPRNGIT